MKMSPKGSGEGHWGLLSVRRKTQALIKKKKKKFSPWRTVQRLLRKLNIKLQYDPAIPLLGIIYPDKIRIQKDTCTPVFIAALFTIAKTYNGLLLSH